MKIIGGQLKGRNFYMPAEIRPTQHIVRKALFDLLGQDMTGVEFLELFAGSGAIGLEALSRGAKRVVFVEKESKCVDVIEENIEILKIIPDEEGNRTFEVIQGNALAFIKILARQKKDFDIVFADPPYGRGLAKKSLKILGACDIVRPNCTVVIQHEKKETLPEMQGRFLLLRQKKYGASLLSFYEVKNEEEKVK